MTPRQEMFVEEYLIDLNGTRAAIRAGYAPHSAQSYSSTLLSRPEIAGAVQAAMDARAKRTGITRERVIEELARIAFADLRLLADWGPEGASVKPAAAIAEEAAAVIAGLRQIDTRGGQRVALATFDKKKALDTLAAILGLNRAAMRRGPAQTA